MSVDLTRAVFNQADTNHDGTIDRSEFNRWAHGGVGSGTSGYEWSSGYGGGYGGGYGAGYGGAYGAGYGAGYGGLAGLSGYESSVAYGSGGYGAGLVAGGGGGAWESSAGWAGAAGAAGAVVDNSAVWSASATAGPTYPTDAQGLYIDSNPQVIRRPAAAGVQTYTQNIAVRFLQPPPVPPHGPLIIREVRPVQPPAPPPLRIRQQAPPLPTPPPLVLRERPPVAPVPLASQTVIRRLPALPVPPRSVIIERLPPLPPRPRDIVIERWVPYGALAKRRTLVQRAGAAVQYARPRNVIIQYEPSQARIVRQFQRLGVVAANPSAYVQTYGGSLLDAGSLLQQARSAGVVEDISPPAPAVIGYSSAAYGQDLGLAAGGWEGSYGYGGSVGLAGGASSWEGDYGYAGGYGGGYGLGGGYGYSSGYGGGYGLGGGWESSASSYEGGWTGGVDVAGAAFNSADVNHDGRLDRAEFNRFVAGGL